MRGLGAVYRAICSSVWRRNKGALSHFGCTLVSLPIERACEASADVLKLWPCERGRFLLWGLDDENTLYFVTCVVENMLQRNSSITEMPCITRMTTTCKQNVFHSSAFTLTRSPNFSVSLKVFYVYQTFHVSKSRYI